MTPPNKQNIDGILLVNKPQGLSSNAVLQKVKKLYQAKKAGHTGSLDPLATGMLPVCFGEATKVSQFLLNADKSYEATALLGIKTDTGDSTGKILTQVDNFSISKTQLEAVLQKFIGHIRQVPSMYSALKHQGKPLYHYARAGIEIARESREILIKSIQLTHLCQKEFSIVVECSKGTYIRNLIEDIGAELGVGAHVTRLHRRYTSGFSEEAMYSIEDLEAMTVQQRMQLLFPIDRAVNFFPEICLHEIDVVSIRQGKTLDQRQLLDRQASGLTRLYDRHAQFIGLGELHDSGALTAKRLLATSSLHQ